MPRSGLIGTATQPPGTTPQQPNTVIQSSVWNAAMNDIYQTLNTAQPVAYGGTGATSEAEARSKLGVPSVSDVRGNIFGLMLSNNISDPTNDIDVAAGSATSASGVASMVLGSGITKRLDAAWASGTGNGGRFDSAIINATWHIYVIGDPTSGLVDVGFSTNASNPSTDVNYPPSYSLYRRIGSIIRTGGGILQFVQRSDTFLLKTPILSFSNSGTGSAALTITATTPTGIITEAFLNVRVDSTSGNSVYISDLETSDVAPGSVPPGASLGAATSIISGQCRVFTNTSAQFRARLVVGALTDTLYVVTLGWVDSRNRT